MNQIALSSGVFYPVFPTEETPALVAGCGIDRMEVMLQSASEYDPAFLRRLSANAREAGVAIGSVHLFRQLHPFWDPYPRRREEAWKRLHHAIAWAAGEGMTHLVWHGPDPEELPPGATLPDWLPVVAEVGAACAEAGLVLGLENNARCAVRSVRDVTAIASALGDAPGIGWVWDSFQADRSGVNGPLLLATMASRLVGVHLNDALTSDHATRHLLPGAGELPIEILLRAVQGSGFQGPLVLEGKPAGDVVPEVGAAASLVRQLQGKIDRAAADPCAALPPAGVREGIALFNAGRYYECHEAIEAEWHAERGQVRRLYQGILQVGVGFHHAAGGNWAGAVALLSDGIAKVSDFLPSCMGVDTARLARESEGVLAELHRRGPNGIDRFHEVELPQIREIPAAPQGE